MMFVRVLREERHSSFTKFDAHVQGVGFVEIHLPGQRKIQTFKSNRLLEFVEDLPVTLPRLRRRWILGGEFLTSNSSITLAATKQKEQ
jgi:hypothetical protein